MLLDFINSNTGTKESKNKNNEPINLNVGLNDYKPRCLQLPKGNKNTCYTKILLKILNVVSVSEWTVIQLCKQLNLDKDWQTFDEHMNNQQQLNLTLFHYERLNLLNNEPTKFIFGSEDLNIFKSSFEAFKEISEQMRKSKEPADLGKAATSTLNEFLGPWIVIFCGKVKNENGKHFEKILFCQVDRMCDDSKEK